MGFCFNSRTIAVLLLLLLLNISAQESEVANERTESDGSKDLGRQSKLWVFRGSHKYQKEWKTINSDNLLYILSQILKGSRPMVLRRMQRRICFQHERPWKKEEIEETEERMRRNQRDHEEDKRAKDAEDRGTN